MKIILMGSSGVVVPVFESLRKGHEGIGVYTRAPKPSGRKRVITPTPVHSWASQYGIPVFTSISDFKNDGADFVVVMSYGVIIPDDVLAQGRFINVHPSDLPKYRGPSPIRQMLKNGDDESAVCLAEVVHEVDAGGVFIRRKFSVGENDTNEDIEARSARIAIDLLSEYFLSPETYPALPQVGEPIITKKFHSSDAVIDWSMPPQDIHNLVRAFGYAKAEISGIGVKILKTRCENGKLVILEIQPDGRRPMSWADFTNGYL